MNYAYPPSTIFTSRDLYALIAQWSLPTLVLPIILGNLISFQNHPDVDPITAGIVRLVCAISSHWGVPEELLSSKTRVVSAATVLAFSVAEILAGRGQAQVAKQEPISTRERRFPAVMDTPRATRRLLTES